MYILLHEISHKDRAYKILGSSCDLSKIKDLHDYYLTKYDPDVLAISRSVPVTVKVTYKDSDQGIETQLQVEV